MSKIALNSDFIEGGIYKLADNIIALDNVLHNKCVKKEEFVSTSLIANDVYPSSFIIAVNNEHPTAYYTNTTIKMTGSVDIDEMGSRVKIETTIYYSNTYNEDTIIGEYNHTNKKYFIAPFIKDNTYVNDFNDAIITFSVIDFNSDLDSFKIEFQFPNDDSTVFTTFSAFYAVKNNEGVFEISEDEINGNIPISMHDIVNKTINVKITEY